MRDDEASSATNLKPGPDAVIATFHLPDEWPAIDVVIPCYRAASSVGAVIRGVLAQACVRQVVLVDDTCTEGSADVVEALFPAEKRLVVLRHESNRGVGGAVKTGYAHAFDAGADIVVKIDADGQMRADDIPLMVRPILEKRADYTKGNRFYQPKQLKAMPSVRLMGNSVLSMVNKCCSGYWSIMDPTNGFTALHRCAYRQLEHQDLADDYFFESDMLFQLGLANAVVRDLPIAAIYGDEKSSLRIVPVLMRFPGRFAKRAFKRVVFKYLIRDFNVASLEMIAGLLLLGGGFGFGVFHWVKNFSEGEITPAGTVMIVGITMILGFQLLLSAVNYDVSHEPSVPLLQIIR